MPKSNFSSILLLKTNIAATKRCILALATDNLQARQNLYKDNLRNACLQNSFIDHRKLSVEKKYFYRLPSDPAVILLQSSIRQRRRHRLPAMLELNKVTTIVKIASLA